MSAASLPILLRAMRLPTIAREHEKATARAEAENWGYHPREAGRVGRAGASNDSED